MSVQVEFVSRVYQLSLRLILSVIITIMITPNSALKCLLQTFVHLHRIHVWISEILSIECLHVFIFFNPAELLSWCTIARLHCFAFPASFVNNCSTRFVSGKSVWRRKHLSSEHKFNGELESWQLFQIIGNVHALKLLSNWLRKNWIVWRTQTKRETRWGRKFKIGFCWSGPLIFMDCLQLKRRSFVGVIPGLPCFHQLASFWHSMIPRIVMNVFVFMLRGSCPSQNRNSSGCSRERSWFYSCALVVISRVVIGFPVEDHLEGDSTFFTSPRHWSFYYVFTSIEGKYTLP